MMAESQIMSCFVTICSYFTMTASSHGFVIRAEGLCGFQIRSYITRGLTNCLPPSRLGIAQASLASPLAAPSVTNPSEPKCLQTQSVRLV